MMYRRHRYYSWWESQENSVAIWHLINLLAQFYRRPYWRAAYLLQYANADLLSQALAAFPQDTLEDERIKEAVKSIKAKTVKKYLKKCIEINDVMVEPYGAEILRGCLFVTSNELKTLAIGFSVC